MSESINQRMAKVPDLLTSREIRPLLIAILTDIAALTASLNQLIDDYDNAVTPTTAARLRGQRARLKENAMAKYHLEASAWESPLA